MSSGQNKPHQMDGAVSLQQIWLNTSYGTWKTGPVQSSKICVPWDAPSFHPTGVNYIYPAIKSTIQQYIHAGFFLFFARNFVYLFLISPNKSPTCQSFFLRELGGCKTVRTHIRTHLYTRTVANGDIGAPAKS